MLPKIFITVCLIRMYIYFHLGSVWRKSCFGTLLTCQGGSEIPKLLIAHMQGNLTNSLVEIGNTVNLIVDIHSKWYSIQTFITRCTAKTSWVKGFT